MAKRTDAYVDTSALIAFLDRSDTYHPLFFQLFSDPPSLVTTSLVVAEGHAWFLRRYDRYRALQFIAMVEDLRPLEILSPGPVEQTSAFQMLRKFSDQDLTLVDALGLQIMQMRRIRHCWSTDRHLGLTGVSLVVDER